MGIETTALSLYVHKKPQLLHSALEICSWSWVYCTTDSCYAVIVTAHSTFNLFLQNDTPVNVVTLGLLIVESISHYLNEYPPAALFVNRNLQKQ